jgi:hypothetical protein
MQSIGQQVAVYLRIPEEFENFVPTGTELLNIPSPLHPPTLVGQQVGGYFGGRNKKCPKPLEMEQIWKKEIVELHALAAC